MEGGGVTNASIAASVLFKLSKINKLTSVQNS